MKLSLPAKKLIMVIALCTAAFIAVGAVLCFVLPSLTAGDILSVSLGILLSSVIGIVKVFSLEYQVSRLNQMDNPNKARGLAMFHSLVRYVLTGGGLVAAHFIPFTNLIAALFGAFIWNISVYILRFVKMDEDETAATEEVTADAKEAEAATGAGGKDSPGEAGE